MAKSKVLKIGDRVNWSGSWNTDPVEIATVVDIEKTRPGEKEGISVEEISWKDNFVVTLDNGHWAYKYQLSPIEE